MTDRVDEFERYYNILTDRMDGFVAFHKQQIEFIINRLNHLESRVDASLGAISWEYQTMTPAAGAKAEEEDPGDEDDRIMPAGWDE